MSGSIIEDTREEELEEVTIEETDEEITDTEVESADETETIEVHVLESARVSEIIAKTAKLPDVSIQRLTAAEYDSEESVTAAVQAEVDYVKAITGTGQPPVLRHEKAVPITEADVAERKAAVNEKYLGRFGGKK